LKFLSKDFSDLKKMGDSDDDGDYKRRDKFRSERRSHDGGSSPRREYREARPGPPGGGYRRNYGGGGGGGGGGDRGGDGGYRGRDRYSPPRRHSDMSPPNKRMRGNDWDDQHERGYNRDRGGYDYERGGPPSRTHGDRGGSGGGRGGRGGGGNNASEDADGVQPVMMSFKLFLGTQDDSISDDDAVKKYAEYKLEFKRQQLNEFFVTHKDEECNTRSWSWSRSSPEAVQVVRRVLLPVAAHHRKNPPKFKTYSVDLSQIFTVLLARKLH